MPSVIQFVSELNVLEYYSPPPGLNHPRNCLVSALVLGVVAAFVGFEVYEAGTTTQFDFQCRALDYEGAKTGSALSCSPGDGVPDFSEGQLLPIVTEVCGVDPSSLESRATDMHGSCGRIGAFPCDYYGPGIQDALQPDAVTALRQACWVDSAQGLWFAADRVMKHLDDNPVTGVHWLDDHVYVICAVGDSDLDTDQVWDPALSCPSPDGGHPVPGGQREYLQCCGNIQLTLLQVGSGLATRGLAVFAGLTAIGRLLGRRFVVQKKSAPIVKEHSEAKLGNIESCLSSPVPPQTEPSGDAPVSLTA